MRATLTPAAAGHKATLGRLLELHQHDLSEYTGDRIHTDGSFGYRYLDAYWIEDSRRPYLIYQADELAGFVLIRLLVPGMLDPTRRAHNIAEFFILRKFRRRGLGRDAACQAFDLYPGYWEVFQVADHPPALAFWRAVISGYTQRNYREAVLDHQGWRGTVQGFDTIA